MAFLLGLNVALTESIQKSVNETINETIISSDSGCSQSSGQSFNVTSEGDWINYGDISQTATIDMNCIIENDIDATFRNKLKQTLIEDVETVAEQKGFPSFSTNIASSKVVQDSLNRLVNSFTASLTTNCGSSISQTFDVVTEGGDWLNTGDISQGAESILNCEFTNDLVVDLANDLEQEIILKVKTKAKQEGFSFGGLFIIIAVVIGVIIAGGVGFKMGAKNPFVLILLTLAFGIAFIVFYMLSVKDAASDKDEEDKNTWLSWVALSLGLGFVFLNIFMLKMAVPQHLKKVIVLESFILSITFLVGGITIKKKKSIWILHLIISICFMLGIPATLILAK